MSAPSPNWLGPALCWAIAAVYAISFVLPAAPAPILDLLGIYAFLQGATGGYCATGSFSIIFFIMWLANPTFVVGAVFLARERWMEAALLGMIAASLASSWIIPDDLRAKIPPDWLVPRRPIAPLIGYYVWLASMLLLSLAGSVGQTCAIVHSRCTPKEKRGGGSI